ncbi:MAG: FtsX-like permease family protein [Clostridiales bacterium]|nr:FtsX-like permease family protein [Clostridiales bacterium]
MTKRKMFFRMITASLLRRRSRMLIALLSIGIGATILAGLVTVYYDVPRQMARQFRSYGANMILLPEDGALQQADVDQALEQIPADQLIGATPYRYVRLDMVTRQQSFVTAGTDFAEVQKTSPYFSVTGAYPEKQREVLVGKNVADTIGAKPNSIVELTYRPGRTQAASTEHKPGDSIQGSAEGYNHAPVYVTAKLGSDMTIESISVDASLQTEEIGSKCGEEPFTSQFIGKTLPLALGEDVDALTGATMTSQGVVDALNTAVTVDDGAQASYTLNFTVTGILETGGEEEDYFYMSMDDLETITGERDVLDVVELSVSGSSDELAAESEAITADTPGVSARLVKRVTKSETSVLSKLQALVFLVTVVVLVLTMVSVSTTMMAVVTERRREIGLRKALGASDGSIRVEFLGEGLFLGGLGGILGAVLGFVFAQVVSVNVFGSDIRFNFWLLPLTVLVSMAVAALSCLLPVKRAVAIDPALVLKGE